MPSLCSDRAVATAASALPGLNAWVVRGAAVPRYACCMTRLSVASRVNDDTGREDPANELVPGRVRQGMSFPSPDGGYHACWGNATGRPNFRCIILPGMASLAPSEGSARITSNFLFSSREKPAALL
jgi:hypothetical protein